MPEEINGSDSRTVREKDFWGHHLPSLEDCIAEFRAGPDRNTELMIDAVGPLPGLRVLDFACGTGVTSAWLAAGGAHVVGLDLSPEALARAAELLERLGLRATLVNTTLEAGHSLGCFDAIVGRYALHHIDVPAVAPLLAGLLRAGGKAAFVETFASNPVLRMARRRLVGRLGIPRYGTLDEQPLRRGDVDSLRSAFGRATTSVAELRFLRILDRQVLHFRHPRASAILGGVDDRLLRLPGAASLSYHQVVVLEKGR